jgi:hypothetical protein
MTNGLLVHIRGNISSYIRKAFLIYDFPTVPLWISLYMSKIWFSFLSVYMYFNYIADDELLFVNAFVSKKIYLYHQGNFILKTKKRTYLQVNPRKCSWSEVLKNIDVTIFLAFVCHKIVRIPYLSEKRDKIISCLFLLWIHNFVIIFIIEPEVDGSKVGCWAKAEWCKGRIVPAKTEK